MKRNILIAFPPLLLILSILLRFGADAQILNQVLYGITPIIKTPVDSPGAGTYSSTQSVTITDATADFIRYTTDGSTPSFTSGPLYSGAFNISATTTLKAIGCTLLDAKCGGVLTSVYTISAVFTPVYLTSGPCTSGGASCTVTLSVTAGQFAVCSPGSNSGAAVTFTCADTDDGGLTQAPGSPQGYASSGALFFKVMGTTNVSEVFTCTASSSAVYMGCVVATYSGTPTSGWDVTVPATAMNSFGSPGPNAWVSGTSSATANNSELGVGVFVQHSGGTTVPSWSGTNGWTLRNAANADTGAYLSIAYFDKVLSSTGTQTLTANSTSGTGSTPSGPGLVSTIK